MSALYYLRSDDFLIKKGQKGNILCHNIKNLSLILFYSTSCVYCKTFIKVFKELPTKISGCSVGIINISHNMKIADMSKDTIMPLKFVPYIVLYYNGRPYMRYNGPSDINEIIKFISEISQQISQKLQNKHKQTNPNIKKNKGGIPSYCTGKPLYGDNEVCYLEFKDFMNLKK